MGIDHLAVVEEHSGSFTGAVTGNLGAPVAACPGWTVDDLVAHLAEVRAWWTAVVPAKGAYPGEAAARRAADTGPDRVAGWREISARYVAVREEHPRSAGPDAPGWAWWTEERSATAAALVSRQAHEAVVHRRDAWRAAGVVRSIPAGPAAGGVDEFPERFLDGVPWAGGPAVPELVATDTGGRWLVGTDGSGEPARWAEGAAGGAADARVSGSAQQLYLLLWRRVGVGEVEVAGDRSKAEALLGWPDLSRRGLVRGVRRPGPAGSRRVRGARSRPDSGRCAP
ncbi:maleylpyruvate isomerase family mycothiol-dependent enzyme [Actinosynnema sp. NPDC053489]|uniref:maleylpyruvate isomerase family mycothiol-dependent enzyme n=1 Tax=Actinosynnema sp. NPDC053489 TaxID=3363916 RepID=UPI0037C8820B